METFAVGHLQRPAADVVRQLALAQDGVAGDVAGVRICRVAAAIGDITLGRSTEAIEFFSPLQIKHLSGIRRVNRLSKQMYWTKHSLWPISNQFALWQSFPEPQGTLLCNHCVGYIEESQCLYV